LVVDTEGEIMADIILVAQGEIKGSGLESGKI
jgi:hypothetical protein